jgi:hypothetical protein
MMKKSSSFSVDLLNSPLPHAGGSNHTSPANGDGGDTRCEDDLYFEMEFPVHSHHTSRLSVESYGSQSTLDSRESPSREEYRSAAAVGGARPPPRERPNSLVIPIIKNRKGDLFGSLPRSKVHRVPKISLPNYSVPVTPADSWENGGNYLGNANLSGRF